MMVRNYKLGTPPVRLIHQPGDNVMFISQQTRHSHLHMYLLIQKLVITLLDSAITKNFAKGLTVMAAYKYSTWQKMQALFLQKFQVMH
jgi:hypothetical protein